MTIRELIESYKLTDYGSISPLEDEEKLITDLESLFNKLLSDKVQQIEKLLAQSYELNKELMEKVLIQDDAINMVSVLGIKEPMPSYIDTVLKEFDRKFWNGTSAISYNGTPPKIFNQGRYEETEEMKAFLKSSLEHFAQVVEKEVLVTNGYEYLDEYADKEDYIKLELIESQKERLKALLHPTQEEKV